MRLMWNRPDGSCCTTLLIDDEIAKEARRRGIDPKSVLAETVEKIKAARPDLAGVEPVEVPDVEDPGELGREAWGHGGKIDMTRARACQMNRIRKVRDAMLEDLDVETVKAVGAGDTARRDEVEAEKQKLRDIPQTFDLSKATTPDELKALWPFKDP